MAASWMRTGGLQPVVAINDRHEEGLQLGTRYLRGEGRRSLSGPTGGRNKQLSSAPAGSGRRVRLRQGVYGRAQGLGAAGREARRTCRRAAAEMQRDAGSTRTKGGSGRSSCAPAHLRGRGGGGRRLPQVTRWVGSLRDVVGVALLQGWDFQRDNVMRSLPPPETGRSGWRRATLESGAGVWMQGGPHVVECWEGCGWLTRRGRGRRHRLCYGIGASIQNNLAGKNNPVRW